MDGIDNTNAVYQIRITGQASSISYIRQCLQDLLENVLIREPDPTQQISDIVFEEEYESHDAFMNVRVFAYNKGDAPDLE